MGESWKQATKDNWQLLSVLAACFASVVLVAVQLGEYRAMVQVNTHRLDNIERHDIETRDIEARLGERISRLESELRPPR